MTEPTATGLYAQHQHAPGTVLAGRFRIEGILGVGGMGVVYRATDLALDVPVALKLLRPELATRPDAFERFRQELLMARQVSSPRVVRIHDLAQHEGQWLISMDFIDGEGLDRRLDREGAIAPDVAAGIARQLAEGLAAAHARGVIHRDLKPANVLIDREGNAYISDFGVARSLASNGLTQSGAVVGTPDYLSPEQARGDTVDARSDLYSLGLILYEMLTGAMPFQGGTLGEILAQRMLRSPPPVTQAKPQTPAWLARLTDRLLRVQPGHRLQSADAVIRAIDTREVPRQLYRPTPRQAVVGVLLLAVLAIGGFAAWRTLHRPIPEGVATVAPLHRLLVLPVEAPANAISDARGSALASLLRNAIASVPGVAVVDDDRTQQALRQLDPTGTVAIDADALQRIVGADRTLRVALQPSGKRWKASAKLKAAAGSSIFEAVADDPSAAFAQLARQPVLAMALDAKAHALPFALPACAAPCAAQPLDAYGAALLAEARSEPAEALRLSRSATAASPDFALAWLMQSEMAQAVGEMDAAYEALERGQDSARKVPVSMQRRFRAERALMDGDPPTAAGEWRAEAAATPDNTFADLGYAKALGAGGDFKGAIAALQKLVARDPNDPRAWFELGKFSILAGQAQPAVDEYLVRALVLYRRSGNRYGESETANAMGIGYARLGQSDDAEQQYREAVELRRAVGNRRGLATSLRNLGNILSQRGKFDEAARTLKQAGELHAALGDRAGLAAVENELGVLAEERGDYPAALAAFRRALQTWQQIGEKPGTAQALNDIGFAHYQLGAYDDAQAYLVQSANAYAELGDETGRIRTQQNLGLLAIARGQWNEARRQLDASLKSAEQQQMLEEAAVSRRNLAELELQLGHLDAAIEQAGKAEAQFRAREDWRGLADAGLLRVQALLFAHADVDARKALDELASAVKQASTEQRGIAALLQAELEDRARDRAARDLALADARRLARASGVKQLQLLVALHEPADAARLDRETSTLGNVPLRLQWTEAEMRRLTATAAGHAQAARLYREALPLLRRGDYLRAFQLHALGSKALSTTDAAAGASASGNACRALEALHGHLPPALRTSFDASDEVRPLGAGLEC
ncbi:protein kinase [Lysobacter niabensis]|uniref:protein kinase domain-containing protein n=1 Tax=Agrilutibacter niabensis TaxID=380628 RepID=UPI0036164546